MRIFDLVGSGNIYVTFYTALTLLPCFLLLHRAEYLSEQNRAKKSTTTARAGKRRGFITRRRLIIAAAFLLLFFTWGLRRSFESKEEPVRETVIRNDETFLAVRAESSVFLDRRIIRLSLEARYPPELFMVQLESAGTLIIYDTPMPYRFSQDNRSVSFILGEAPDNPFHTELILPQDFSGALKAGALYKSPVPELSDNTGAGDYILTVERTLPLP